MTADPLDQYVALFLSIVAVWTFFEFHKELAIFFGSCYKKYRCKLGYHNAEKSKYYCKDCKKSSKPHLKIVDGEGRYKKKAKEFKF